MTSPDDWAVVEEALTDRRPDGTWYDEKLIAARSSLARLREREAQNEMYLRECRDSFAEVEAAAYRNLARAEEAEARIAELEQSLREWNADHLLDDNKRLQARVAELEQRLQDCYDAGEHAVGERQDRVAQLERERDDAKRHHQLAVNKIITQDGDILRAEARVAELNQMLVVSEEHTQFHEARVARLEECVGLLPPKWADQFWFNWREHPGLPALAHEEEARPPAPDPALVSWQGRRGTEHPKDMPVAHEEEA